MKNASKLIINASLVMFLFAMLIFPMVSIGFVGLKIKSNVLATESKRDMPTVNVTPAPTVQETTQSTPAKTHPTKTGK